MNRETSRKKVAAKPKATEEKKVPGVIDRIVEVLQNGGGTLDQIAEKVIKHFPERKLEAVRATATVQVNRLEKSKENGGRNLKVKREPVEEGSTELRYFI